MRVRGWGETHEIGDSLQAILFRQPVFLRNTPAQSLTPDEQLSRSQWQAFLRGLSVFERAAWMNRPASTYLAESKPYQLAVARQCGFLVPETLVTNDVERIQGYLPAEIAIKSVDTVLLYDQEEALFSFTRAVSSSALSESSLSRAPVTAQRLLEPKVDLRVTVVGDRTFAVKILSNGRGVAGDWREAEPSSLEYVDAHLPKGIQDCCRALMCRLGLNFGGLDLAETPNGIYFVEVNPTGEWSWLSNAQRPIGPAIADWLANPPRNCSV